LQSLHLGKTIVLSLFVVMLAAAQQPQPAHPAQSARPTPDVIGPTSHIVPPPPTFSMPEETYVYSAEWKIWNAGTVTLSFTREGNEPRVNGTADSQGFVSVLYPVHDRFQAVYDPKTFCSITMKKHIEEGSHKRDTLITFNYSRKKSVLDETNLKTKETKHVENDIPGCVTDVMSGLMYLRSLPLIQGSTYTFPLNDGGKTVDVVTKVEGKETVKVPGGTFETIRVSPESGNAFKLKGKVWIWYTDDARRIPVQMRGKMFWGTLTFKLQRIEPNKK
jgi:hypothetical protein